MPERPKIKYKPGYKQPHPGRKPFKGKKLRASRDKKRTEKRLGIRPGIVVKSIIENRGLISEVCKALSVPRTTLVRYIEKHEVCLEALGNARDNMGDVAEQKLFDKIEGGDTRCLLYYLATVQRHRGYGQAAADSPENTAARGPVFVETVNIVGIPSGTFLPKEIASKDNMVIEN